MNLLNLKLLSIDHWECRAKMATENRKDQFLFVLCFFGWFFSCRISQTDRGWLKIPAVLEFPDLQSRVGWCQQMWREINKRWYFDVLLYCIMFYLIYLLFSVFTLPLSSSHFSPLWWWWWLLFASWCTNTLRGPTKQSSTNGKASILHVEALWVLLMACCWRSVYIWKMASRRRGKSMARCK